jgi:hypothetical protein
MNATRLTWPAALLLFALAHEVRIVPDPRIIHEHAAINLAYIHSGDLAGKEITGGSWASRGNCAFYL